MNLLVTDHTVLGLKRVVVLTRLRPSKRDLQRSASSLEGPIKFDKWIWPNVACTNLLTRTFLIQGRCGRATDLYLFCTPKAVNLEPLSSR